MMRLSLIVVLTILVALSGAASTVHARNMAGGGADANECVSVVVEMGSTGKIMWVPSDYKYWHFTVRNVCPHPIEFHHCFFRLKNSTCGTRSAYYESVRTINGYQKHEIADRNPILVLAPEKNTVRLEWLACPANGSGMPKPGLWWDARSCRM